MAGIITKRFRANNAEQFYESLNEAAATRLFIFIGRVTPFTNEVSPPLPIDTVQITEFDAYRDMIAMKRVQPSDASYVTLRYNWTNNTTYTTYTDTNASLYPTSTTSTSNTTFYVITEDNNMYKCIDNNRSSRSTQKPTGTGTTITTTSDGYRWKFMYNVSAAEALKFLTTAYVPVKTLSANDGSAQWSVQQSAANGAIHHISISANGSGYLSTSNTISSVTNSTVIILKSNSSATDKIYNGSTIFLSSGLGSGQIRRIVNYVGASRTLTVNGSFSTTPNTSTTYIIGPNVGIRGDSGSTTATRASAYVSNCYAGQVRKITIISTGLNYSTANVVITANSSHGTGAIATPIISPPGGHGADAVGEFAAHNVMLNVKLSGAESNTFPTNNEFRMIGLIRDPKLRSGPAANASVIDQCSRIIVTTLNGDLTQDEIVTGSTSGAKARFVRFANTNTAKTAGIVRVIRVTTNGTGGTFRVGETITGSTSGRTATIASFIKPALREFTGDVIYNENHTYITRGPDQTEDIKMVVKF
jgi:hypothetical protein